MHPSLLAPPENLMRPPCNPNIVRNSPSRRVDTIQQVWHPDRQRGKGSTVVTEQWFKRVNANCRRAVAVVFTALVWTTLVLQLRAGEGIETECRPLKIRPH